MDSTLRSEPGQDASSRRPKAVPVALTTVTAGALVIVAVKAFGPQSGWFALMVVWIPMVWLGIVSRFAQPRMPDAYHRLRPFERTGVVYERVGIRFIKRMLRRGPLATFNPDLHLPTGPTTTNVAHLDQRMRDAEASHFILFMLTFGVIANAALRGWWGAAGLTLLFNVILNGYPVMLQRYNRAFLARRFR